MENLVIAAAQTSPKDGDYHSNLSDHLRFIDLASEYGTEIIVFPEMSLTGYMIEEAGQYAFSIHDSRLLPLVEKANKFQMTIITGAPVQVDERLYIGAHIILPDNTIHIYTKHFLHTGEERAFVPGNLNSLIRHKGEIASLAVCADICNPKHAQMAHDNQSSIYLASVFITPGGIDHDSALIAENARKFKMFSIMSNFTGSSCRMESAGQSAAWDSRGSLIACMVNEEGLLITKRKEGQWEGVVVV
jgi:predicted amidohydrolase